MAARHSTAPEGFVSIGDYRSDPVIAETFTPNDIRRLIAAEDLPGIKSGGRYFVRQGEPMPDPNLLTDLPGQCFTPPLTPSEIEEIADSAPGPEEGIWGKWARKHYPSLRRRAIKKGLDFRLTCDRLVRMVESTGGKCEVTGIPFSDENPDGAFRRPWMPSVDRGDSSEGYTPGNCRIVCVAVNQAMGEHGESVLLRIVEALASR